MKRITSTLIVTVACLFAIGAQAECKQDSSGTVYCSEVPTGGAELDRVGSVVCGKGQCRTDEGGTVKCSKVEGGGAAVDSLGIVKCLGGCERARRAMCVRGDS